MNKFKSYLLIALFIAAPLALAQLGGGGLSGLPVHNHGSAGQGGTTLTNVAKTNAANTFTANQKISKSGALFDLDGTGGTNATLRLLDDGVLKWELGKSVGNDLELDDGTTIRFSITRTTGAATYTGTFNTTGDLSEASNRVYSAGNPPPAPTTAYAYLTTSTTVPISTNFAVPMDVELYDDAVIHDLVTNNTRFTVPVGFTRARFLGQSRLNGGASSIWRFETHVRKNGLIMVPQVSDIKNLSASEQEPRSQVDTGWVPVVAGDYFELFIFHNTATAQVTGVNLCWGMFELKP